MNPCGLKILKSNPGEEDNPHYVEIPQGYSVIGKALCQNITDMLDDWDKASSCESKKMTERESCLLWEQASRLRLSGEIIESDPDFELISIVSKFYSYEHEESSLKHAI